jgi:hypothetical protein
MSCPKGHRPAVPAQCVLCRRYVSDPVYRIQVDAHAAPKPSPRALPCVYLGEVLDKRNCPCPGKWLRRCELYQTCTLESCKKCVDYEPQ